MVKIYLTFSKASLALEISSLIKTSLSEYKLLATISSKRLVSVLNSCLTALPTVFSLTLMFPSSGILSSSSSLFYFILKILKFKILF